MDLSLGFFINSILFGFGLAMDAFSVSMANGLNEPKMKKSKMLSVAGVFGMFQTLMPLTGWVCVHTIAEKFTAFQKLIPWIALVLLLFIGGKMLVEGIKNKGDGEDEAKAVGIVALLIQGIATSIDALSAGFIMAELSWQNALVEALLIGVLTFGICIVGVLIGKKFGTVLSKKAAVFGGVILIGIGVEIFVKGVFFG